MVDHGPHGGVHYCNVRDYKVFHFILIMICIYFSNIDVMVLRELIDHVEVASRRKSGFSGSIFSIEKEPLKDKVERLLCSWEVPRWFAKIQEWVGFVILDAFVDLFITLCILANTAFMAADQHGMTPEMGRTLEMGNQVS